MKRLPIFYISVFLLALTACHRASETKLHPALARAERLMTSHPDSALLLLQHYRLAYFRDSADMAAYALLRTQADDKNYITHTSDSLIRVAVVYYDRHGDSRQKALAHYYWGRVYQDKGDDVNTARQFLHASNLADEKNDKLLSCTIYSNLGYLLWNNNIMLDEADSLYNKAILIEKELNDNEGLAISYKNLGDISLSRGIRYYKRAKLYLDSAHSISKRISNMEIKRDILSSYTILYRYQRKYYQSISVAKYAIRMTPFQLCDGYFYNIGADFSQLNRPDSALAYLTKSLSVKECKTKESVYRELSDVFHKLGRTKESTIYRAKFDSCELADYAKRTPENVITTIKDSFIQQLVKRQHDDKGRRYYLYATSFFLLFIAFYITYRLYDRRIKKMKLSHINEIKITETCLKEFISYNKKEKGALLQQIKDQERASSNISNSSETNTYIELHTRLLDISKHNAHNSDEKQIKIEENDWKEIKNRVELITPNFTDILSTKYPLLSENDIHFCYLVRLELKYSEIASILSVSRGAIYKRNDHILKLMNRNHKEIKLIEVLLELK
jgi:tetratricopeptide (TPR) repeat protein